MPKHTSRTEKIYRHILILGTIAADPNLLAHLQAGIAQLGERQTEDLKVPGSIPRSRHDLVVAGETAAGHTAL